MKLFTRWHVFMLLLALGLPGCQTVNLVTGGPEVTYTCVEGSVLTLRPASARRSMDATYTYAGQVVYRGPLAAIGSDFGERFRAADGTSFWMNDQKGLFSRPGEDMILCHKAP